MGRQFAARGNRLTGQKFRGGTIFCDAASAKLTVIHQVGLTGTETVQAKLRLEREAAAAGVPTTPLEAAPVDACQRDLELQHLRAKEARIQDELDARGQTEQALAQQQVDTHTLRASLAQQRV